MTDDDLLNQSVTVYEPRAPKAESTLSPGQTFDERYAIIRELGQGGMGVAYLALDELSKEEVVVKIIHPSLIDQKARDRMIAEGVITRKIRNPKIVSVYDVKESDGQIFLVMEYVEGSPLRHWMQQNMNLHSDAPLEQVTRIAHEILAGLTSAHEAGVVHRDLKPENIMINGDPSDQSFGLKILDFGIATGIKTEVFTSSVASVGTPLYMAPEQKTAPNAVKGSADVYSVGRMLYEMLMDVLPDGMWNPPSTVRSDIPQALDDVIHKALQPPKSRYQTAAEFSAAILKATSETEISNLSRVAWTSPGSERMLSELKSIDQDLYRRVLDPSFKSSSHQTGYSGGSSESSTASNSSTETDTNKTEVETKKTDQPKWKKYALYGAVGLGAAVILSMFEEDDTVYNELPLTQSWRLDEGGVISMSMSDGFISGSGIVQPIGPVNIQGDPRSGQLQVFSGGAYVADILGSLNASQGGQDFTGELWSSGMTLRPIRFHIDH